MDGVRVTDGVSDGVGVWVGGGWVFVPVGRMTKRVAVGVGVGFCWMEALTLTMISPTQ
jgi:hypothetical protein